MHIGALNTASQRQQDRCVRHKNTIFITLVIFFIARHKITPSFQKQKLTFKNMKNLDSSCDESVAVSAAPTCVRCHIYLPVKLVARLDAELTATPHKRSKAITDIFRRYLNGELTLPEKLRSRSGTRTKRTHISLPKNVHDELISKLPDNNPSLSAAAAVLISQTFGGEQKK